MVTGQPLRGTPTTIMDRQAQLDSVLTKFLPSRPEPAPSPPTQPVDIGDSDLLERAFAAKNGAAFPRAVERLVGGVPVAKRSGPCALFDARVLDHPRRGAHRLSVPGERAIPGRSRIREDYRQRTIDFAISNTTEIFTAVGIQREPPGTATSRPPEDRGVEPFLGLSHADVLDLHFGDEPSELIDGLIPRGVLVTVAGLPETYKGWVCAKAAAIVAAGEGELFGADRRSRRGRWGTSWQDDSTRNEAERVQLFARVHETPCDLPVRWFLNEGVILPGDLGRLRRTIEHYGFVLVVLDSVYNFTPTLDLKDREVGQLFARIKAEICDATGCTVVLVDHMPWANETNRKQHARVRGRLQGRRRSGRDLRRRRRLEALRRSSWELDHRLQEDASRLGCRRARTPARRFDAPGGGGRGTRSARAGVARGARAIPLDDEGSRRHPR